VEARERTPTDTVPAARITRMLALRTIDMTIASSLDIRVTFNVLLEHVLAQLHPDAAAVLLFNPDLNVLRMRPGGASGERRLPRLG
jgi:hypothetical protein